MQALEDGSTTPAQNRLIEDAITKERMMVEWAAVLDPDAGASDKMRKTHEYYNKITRALLAFQVQARQDWLL
jgi:hypothetical protein